MAGDFPNPRVGAIARRQFAGIWNAYQERNRAEIAAHRDSEWRSDRIRHAD
jgi:hypothetical protein